MQKAETLKELCQGCLRYVGNGYIYYKISHIPNKKALKTAQILLRVSQHYKTDLSSGKRQYRRKQNLANYQLIHFRSMIIIFRTSGNNADDPGEFKEFGKKGIELKISKDLKLILFRDERQKLTFRLSKENYSFFSGELQKAHEKRNGQKFHILKMMFNNLPFYVGIGKQKRSLNELIKKLQKDNRFKGWGLL